MKNSFDLLSEAEVAQIVTLLAKLDESGFDYLKLQIGDVKLTVSKNRPVALADDGAALVAPAGLTLPPGVEANAASVMAAAAAQPVSAPAPPPAVAAAGREQVAASAAASGVLATGAAQPGTVDVTAPMIGRYYAQAEPGAPPYVTVGQEVEAHTTVALIEVMKVFNAVPAGVRGVITEICVQDGQMVEYGQTLLRLKPV